MEKTIMKVITFAILFVNVNNYIGDSTKMEIEYAKKLGKEIKYYTDLMKNNYQRLCEGSYITNNK